MYKRQIFGGSVEAGGVWRLIIYRITRGHFGGLSGPGGIRPAWDQSAKSGGSSVYRGRVLVWYDVIHMRITHNNTWYVDDIHTPYDIASFKKIAKVVNYYSVINNMLLIYVLNSYLHNLPHY